MSEVQPSGARTYTHIYAHTQIHRNTHKHMHKQRKVPVNPQLRDHEKSPSHRTYVNLVV